jgi:hypothetical protein
MPLSLNPSDVEGATVTVASVTPPRRRAGGLILFAAKAGLAILRGHAAGILALAKRGIAIEV